MAIITISRQFGSGGDEVASQVAQRLGYRVFDKAMMAQAAADMELVEGAFVDFSEDTYKMQGFLDRLLSPSTVAQVKTWVTNERGAKVPEVVNLDEAHSTTLVSATINLAYQRDNMVIVGRGGQAILKERADVLHVRIVAPMNERVQRLVDRANMSYGGAKDAALRHDIASADYLKRFYDIDWADPLHYALVLNTGHLGIDLACTLIVRAVSTMPVRAAP
ncbi:MAG: cytidylate kinase-like family protein [Anaerolineae bacterium]